VFEHDALAGLADCAPSGRARLDAIARWLQDVAYADVEDAGLVHAAAWVVRRTRLHVRRFPRFAEPLRLRTFCSGLGRMWAERRTTICAGDGDGPDVEAVALWIHMDRGGGRPTPLSPRELEVYGAAAGDRRVKARLRHPAPPPDAAADRWHFRATELDLAGHVNNAAYWAPLEESLLAAPEPEPPGIDAEIEFRAPAQPGEKVLLHAGARRWIADPGGEVHASLLVAGR
jgi:acyl-ACP thioesterase